jgi:hypothetical protein
LPVELTWQMLSYKYIACQENSGEWEKLES